MRDEIRKILEQGGIVEPKETKVAENSGLNLSKDDLQKLLEAVVAAAKAPNVIEQKKIDEEIKAQKRKDLAAVELAKIEEQNMWNKKHGCSHCRWPMSMGKLGGHAAPRGQGEWATSGQLHGDGTATMVCMRCGLMTWHWQVTPQEREYIENAGMMGMAPPDESRLIKEETVA